MADRKTELHELMESILKFRELRDWAQFHDPKNLAEAISIEAGELLEQFLWKTPDESRRISADRRKELASELADILIFCLLFAHETGIDVERAIREKIAANEDRYPVHKAKGTSRKYTELK